jgi:hypothetical protein
MSPTDYLGASANPATNFLSDPFSFQTDMLDAGDNVIGAVFAEDEGAYGLVPSYGAEGVASGNTPAVKSAVAALHAAKRNAKALRSSALRAPMASPRLHKAAQQQEKKAGAIQQALQHSWMRRQKLLQGVGADTTAAVEGAGNLEFHVQAPPGIGRLTRVPFQVADAVTPGTLSVLNDQPVVVGAGTAPLNQLLRTPQLPWSVVRLLAVEVQVTIDAPGAAAPDVYFIQNLQAGNAASLFASTGVQPVNFYLQGLELRGGLRDMPIIRAPNFLEITVSWVNSLLVNDPTTAGTTIVCVEAVVDVLADDDFGAHLPGAYARPEALIRKPVGMI